MNPNAPYLELRNQAFSGSFCATHIPISVTSILLGLCHSIVPSFHIQLVIEETILTSFSSHFLCLFTSSSPPHSFPSATYGMELINLYPSFLESLCVSVYYVPFMCSQSTLKVCILPSLVSCKIYHFVLVVIYSLVIHWEPVLKSEGSYVIPSTADTRILTYTDNQSSPFTSTSFPGKNFIPPTNTFLLIWKYLFMNLQPC